MSEAKETVAISVIDLVRGTARIHDEDSLSVALDVIKSKLSEAAKHSLRECPENNEGAVKFLQSKTTETIEFLEAASALLTTGDFRPTIDNVEKAQSRLELMRMVAEQAHKPSFATCIRLYAKALRNVLQISGLAQTPTI